MLCSDKKKCRTQAKILEDINMTKNFLPKEIENESKDTVQIGSFVQEIAEHLPPPGTIALGKEIALQGTACHCSKASGSHP